MLSSSIGAMCLVPGKRPVSILTALVLAVCGGLRAQQVGSAVTDAAAPIAAAGPGTVFAPRDATPSRSEERIVDSRDASVPGTLSAAQILHILQENPGLTVELKSRVADQLSAQGQAIDANSISDETLFAQIASNPVLRSGVSTYLRARGYLSQDDLALASAQGTDGAGDSAVPSTAPGSTALESSGSVLNDAAVTRSDGAPAPSLRMRSPESASIPRRSEQLPRQELSRASTDVPSVLRQPTPYNLQSLRDLYTQLPDDSAPLKRFGSEVFLNRSLSASVTRGMASQDTPLDVPLGPDYILGAGDTLAINVWGSSTQSMTRVVGRDGALLLPEAGSVQVAGLPLGHAQAAILGALKRQFRDAQASVTVVRLRSVRVYVTGDVQRPGGYDLSSLATPVSALFAAGGPTAAGSLRVARHYRGSRLVEEVDLYDFLLRSVRGDVVRFEAGDTLQVPPAGPQVAIAGAVRRPAIYEFRPGESTLADVLGAAGGATASASLNHITVERVNAQTGRITVTVPSSPDRSAAASAAQFLVFDGDRIHIGSVVPFSERVVYLQGHVVRPGRLPFTAGMRLADVLHSYRDLLPEPATRGEIVRLVPPDLHVETIEFNVPDALIGDTELPLQPFDTIRIFGRYEEDAPQVSIGGEVVRPGTYPLSQQMTVAQLVRLAGGFKRAALRETADLTSYTVVDGRRVQSSLQSVRIGDAVDRADLTADFPLKPGDILTVHEITGWSDIGEAITIDGQVRFPGTYGFREGERLSEILRRSGGFRETAYPEGAVLVRAQVRELEQKSRDELIRQIESSAATARLSPNIAIGDPGAPLQLIKAQQEEALTQLKSHPPSGRMVIHISKDLDRWANTPDDIEVRRGDALTVPKRPGFVLVTGQVYNPTALTFTPGKTAAWYLSHAGGANTSANRKNTFVIRANGSVIGRHSNGGWFEGEVLSTKLNAGDVVVVPQKIIGSSLLLRNLLTTAQLASSIAITAAVSGL